MDDSGAGHDPRQPGTPGAPARRISNLSDDILLQVLSHLGCASDAARTALLSRRWRGLFPNLPEFDLTLRDVPLDSLEDALRRAARPGMRLLDIAVPVQDWPTTDSSGQEDWDTCGTISSVLLEAARLSPAQLRFTVPPDLPISPLDRYVAVDLPRFHRATSIDLRAPPQLRLTHSLTSTGFPALESLCISGCHHLDLDALTPLCPRLRVLTVATDAPGAAEFTVQSFSLQELVVDRSSITTRDIAIEAPVLKRLTMSFHANREFTVSISAPMVEKVSWRCSYPRLAHGIGLWDLLDLSLETSEGTRHRAGSCSQLPGINVLSLRMSSAIRPFGFLDGDTRFNAEISKHLVTKFSGLELHLTTKGHTFGSLVWRLLAMNHIAKATRSLRIVLLRSEEVKVACPANCSCDGPWKWRTQPIFPIFERLVIEGFEWEDRGLEFLKLVLGRSPMLKRVNVRLQDQTAPNDDWCTKLHDIFAAYPSVEASVDLIPGN